MTSFTIGTGAALPTTDIYVDVIAIAAGGTVLSHVNDSGFWLVKSHLGISEKETFRSWAILNAILEVAGFYIAALLFYLL